ncbi:MAG: glycosyltransferase family 2 protein [Verrucomicrobia bacterium]|nr:glycosyltransferase family 2 protein [Verrucomicrobiota bacterium]
MLHVLVPMAGKAARFQERGYTFPKPLLEIGSRSMIEVVLENLAPPAPARFTFVCRKEQVTQFFLGDMLRLLAPGCRVLALENETAGALCSVLLAMDEVGPDDEVLVANGDQFINGGLASFYTACRQPDIDGCILTFTAAHPRWSFAKTDERGNVIAVAEKRPISKQATAGLYYFRRARDFMEASERMILKGLTTSGQFYVCPVYNELILAGKRIVTHHLPEGAMHSLGTPEDYSGFIERWNDGGAASLAAARGK